MKKWFRGSTPYLKFYVRDADGALVDPATSVKVSITDAHGHDVVTNVSCTNDGVGIYHYASWTVPTTSVGGRYTWRPQSTDVNVIIEDTEFEFEVMEE